MSTNFVLDKTTILLRLGGDEEIFAAMIDMYLHEVDSYCAQLAQALAAGDAAALQREAHTVKGLLATFADERGAALAQAVESQARNGNCAGLATQVADVQARLRTVAAAVRQEIAG